MSRFRLQIISVFGAKRADKDSFFAQQAYKAGQLLIKKNRSVITGGGPGIMESVLCGAISENKENNKVTLGIGVKGIDIGFRSRCAQHMIWVGNFGDRKELLIRYSSGFIIFPGGYGTMEELSQLVNLIKLHRMPRTPIVLFGTEFWHHYLKWIETSSNADLIAPEFKDVCRVTDDVQEAVDWVSL